MISRKVALPVVYADKCSYVEYQKKKKETSEEWKEKSRKKE